MAEEWLSIVEYARNFAISDMTVRRRIKTGKLKAVLKDGKYYIPTSAGSSPQHEQSKPQSHMGGVPPMGNGFTHYPAKPSGVTHHTTSQQPREHFASRSSIPQNIRTPLQQRDTSPVHTAALLSFCEQALVRFEESEAHIEKRYIAKIESLESQIEKYEVEIKQFKQQVEDLQLLVKVFEQKT